MDLFGGEEGKLHALHLRGDRLRNIHGEFRILAEQRADPGELAEAMPIFYTGQLVRDAGTTRIFWRWNQAKFLVWVVGRMASPQQGYRTTAASAPLPRELPAIMLLLVVTANLCPPFAASHFTFR